MLDKTSDIAIAVEGWLAAFEAALAARDDGALRQLFHPDSYWRDAIALSWTLQTINGRGRPQHQRPAASLLIPTAPPLER